MKTREEYIALITSHAEELQNTFGITSLRLFGSVARNQHHDGSDVDIYVEMPPKFSLVVRLKAYLEALLGRLFKIRIKIWYKKWCYIGVFKLLIFNTLIYKIVL